LPLTFLVHPDIATGLLDEVTVAAGMIAVAMGVHDQVHVRRLGTKRSEHRNGFLQIVFVAGIDQGQLRRPSNEVIAAQPIPLDEPSTRCYLNDSRHIHNFLNPLTTGALPPA
jgi:hypothetical protein